VVVELPDGDPRWAAFASGHPEGLVYHHPAWSKVIERAYGHQPLALGYEDADGNLRGVLPLFRTRGLVTGRRLSSLPRTPVAGPLADGDTAMAALVEAAIDRVQAGESSWLEVKTASAHIGELVAGMASARWDPTYVLELPSTPDEIRFGNSRNHGRITWAVKKAARHGVRLRTAETVADLRSWYSLYLETMRPHAVPPRPFGFFAAIWDILRPLNLARLTLAERPAGNHAAIVAGSFFLMSSATVLYAFNGRRRSELSLRPNDFIQWHAIHDACHNGFRRYDFGEVTDDQRGLAEFKSKWQAEPKSLFRYYFPAERKGHGSKLRSGGRIHRAAAHAWRRLPLPITELIGARLDRHL
jgi:CelD/BcsL family acetyltransferase involved in cellulose biosynthesis